MNSYFSTIGEKLAKELPPPMTNGQQTIEEIANTMHEPLTLTEITVSTQSIRDKVNTLKINKCMGPYNTPQKLLGLAGNAIVSYLVWLYRISIEYKTVFSGWKTAKLTPINKKDDECGNHCPVSCLAYTKQDHGV